MMPGTSSRVWRLLVRVVATVVVLAVLALASLYAFAGTYGFNVIFRRGLWVDVNGRARRRAAVGVRCGWRCAIRPAPSRPGRSPGARSRPGSRSASLR